MIAGLLGAAQPSALATAPTLRYTLPCMKAATGSGGKGNSKGRATPRILANRFGNEREAHSLPFSFGLDESHARCCAPFPPDAFKELFFYSTTSYRYRCRYRYRYSCNIQPIVPAVYHQVSTWGRAFAIMYMYTHALLSCI